MSGHYSSHHEADEPLQTTGRSFGRYWPFTFTALSAARLIGKTLQREREGGGHGGLLHKHAQPAFNILPVYRVSGKGN